MLFVIRSFTAAVFFVFLFVVFFLGSLMVGGGIAGARAHARHPEAAQNFQEGMKLGEQAGAEFAQHYRKPILIGSVAGAGVLSVLVSFSGLLPWCRRKPMPPQL